MWNRQGVVTQGAQLLTLPGVLLASRLPCSGSAGARMKEAHVDRAWNDRDDRTDGTVAVDIVKGAVAGAAGVWVMDQITWGMYLREDPEAFRQEQTAWIGGKDVAWVRLTSVPNLLGGPNK